MQNSLSETKLDRVIVVTLAIQAECTNEQFTHRTFNDIFGLENEKICYITEPKRN